MHRTEDKQYWYDKGDALEQEFVTSVAPVIGVDAIINPEKKTKRTAPDLLIGGEQYGELKSRETPFFMAEELYGLNPQYTVTFNVKDDHYYRTNHPDIPVYFWVRWRDNLTYKNKKVVPMEAVWEIPYKEISDLIARNVFPKHTYKRRVADTQGNAKDSYVIDLLMWMPKKWIVKPVFGQEKEEDD